MKEIGADPERTTTKDLNKLIEIAKRKILSWISETGIDLEFLSKELEEVAAVTSIFIAQMNSPTSDKIKAFVEINNKASHHLQEVKSHVKQNVGLGTFSGVSDGFTLAGGIW